MLKDTHIRITQAQYRKIKNTAKRRKALREADVIRAAIDQFDVEKFLSEYDDK